jgi:hypothetical protein
LVEAAAADELAETSMLVVIVLSERHPPMSLSFFSRAKLPANRLYDLLCTRQDSNLQPYHEKSYPDACRNVERLDATPRNSLDSKSSEAVKSVGFSSLETQSAPLSATASRNSFERSGQFSKAKIRFQSFFLLMTIQPSFFASS